MTSPEPQQPLKEFKAGRVSAACWKSDTEGNGRVVTRWSVKIQKRYQDRQSRDWHSSDYYFGSELADLVLVAQRAFEFVRLRESEEDSDLPTAAA